MESKSIKIIYGYSFFIVSTIFIFLNSVILEFLILLVLLLLGVSFFRFNILHPFVWLSGFVFLYNATFCLLDIFGLFEIKYVHEILFCTYLSIVSLYIFCLLFIRNTIIRFSYAFINVRRSQIIYRLLIVLSIFMILYLPLFIKIGYTSKKEMNLDGGLPLYGIISRLYFIIYAVYLTYYCHINRKLPYVLVISSLVITLGSALIIGERDVFLTVCLLTFLVYYYHFKVSFKKVIFLGIIGMMTVAVLQTTKQITNKDEVNLPVDNMFEATVGGEFATSGSNLNVLLTNKSSWKYQYGEAIINDVHRSLIPDFISKQDNTARWFNQMFNSHLESGYGMGFTYIGEGYVQFGYIGVVVWSIILGVIVLFLYRKAQKHIYGFVAYIYMMGMVLYAMRGDLSYVISPLVKQVLLTYFLLLLLFKYSERKRYPIENASRETESVDPC